MGFTSLAIICSLILAPGPLRATRAPKAGTSIQLNATLIQGAGSSTQTDVIEVLERHIAAIGGREAWRAVKTLESQTEIEDMGKTTTMTRFEDRTTGRFYEVMETQGLKIEAGFDGKRVWQKSPILNGYMDDADPRVKWMTQRNHPSLIDFKASGWSFSRLANEKVGTQDCLVIQATLKESSGSEPPVKFYLDQVTYLLKQIVIGGDTEQRTAFDDYRDVNGRKVAFKQITTDALGTTTARTQSIKDNIPIAPTRFNFPGDAAAAVNVASAGKLAAAAFSFTSLDGRRFELAALRGQVIVLSFWFVGCQPCQAEVPLLNKLVEQFHDQNGVFLAPALDESCNTN